MTIEQSEKRLNINRKLYPIAFIDENGNIVIVGKDNFYKASYVDKDRAFPFSWHELVKQ